MTSWGNAGKIMFGRITKGRKYVMNHTSAMWCRRHLQYLQSPSSQSWDGSKKETGDYWQLMSDSHESICCIVEGNEASVRGVHVLASRGQPDTKVVRCYSHVPCCVWLFLTVTDPFNIYGPATLVPFKPWRCAGSKQSMYVMSFMSDELRGIYILVLIFHTKHARHVSWCF